ncbi:hypothetical protein Y032_0559g3448 [Ancylostoma ceylanicum]|uniref:SCP domain-containing protein n=1 Tax=Ancylostoma ceylanicum TaxID=53326 RepID=A0A016WPV8_9BILA|nr:hypothetical protein Y032_0559g3448 [Ancylostoma ceylanicum]
MPISLIARASCPNPGLTDGIREIFLDMHNRLRRVIRPALQEDRRNEMETSVSPHQLRPCISLYRYDCNAESYAQQHVNTCDGRNQPQSGHPGYKENINVLARQSDFAGAAQWAMASWWGQLASFGMRTDMLFTQAIRSRTTNSVRKFTKVVFSIVLGGNFH